jgi:hypothetical protein
MCIYFSSGIIITPFVEKEAQGRRKENSVLGSE